MSGCEKSYAKITLGGHRSQLARRVAYGVFRDPAHLEGKQIDHICGHKWCVNPWHMKAVTQAEHVQEHESWGWGARKPGVRIKLRLTQSKPKGVKVKIRFPPPVINQSPEAVKRREAKRRYKEKHREKYLAARRAQKVRYR
jgi:hypothetical protein